MNQFRFQKIEDITDMLFLQLTVSLGSIPELPAQSCQEIKASEGKETKSNKYWLMDPTGTGTAVLVYCDMESEGQL